MRPVGGLEALDSDDDCYLRILQTNIRHRLAAAGLSESALSVAIGRNRGWLGALLSRDAAPNAVDIKRIADHLSCSVDALFTPLTPSRSRNPQEIFSDRTKALQKHRGYDRPEVHDIFRWYVANNGTLRNHDEIGEYFDLFKTPDIVNHQLAPYKMGKKSLVAVEFGLQTTEELEIVLKNSHLDVRQEVAIAHYRVMETGKPSTASIKTEAKFSSAVRIIFEYIRLLLPVTASCGERFILNFASPIQRTEITTNELIDLNDGEDHDPFMRSISGRRLTVRD